MAQSLLELAETAQRSWEPQWSGFLDGGDQEDALATLNPLSDMRVQRWGGFEGAERQRLLISRSDLDLDPRSLAAQELVGLELLGNFLFDPAEPDDFRRALQSAGISDGAVGDIWLRGDRGAQAVALASAVSDRNGQELSVRSVNTVLELRPLEQLQPPPARKPRRLSSVEASLRLDAVASAGFGISRSRMADLIRDGAVRINWQACTSPSKELVCGDRVQLQGRGELSLETAERTKKDRWRIELCRR